MNVSEQLIEACARSAHEVNREYCLTLCDASQPRWDDAPDWQKNSARMGVAATLAGAAPEVSHENWMRFKESDGWKYGPVKNVEKREHPCMVPYKDLPPGQKFKDTLFQQSVLAEAYRFMKRVVETGK